MNRRLYQLDHTTWSCEYHFVWCPKYRGKVLEDTYIKNQFKEYVQVHSKMEETVYLRLAHRR